MDKLVNTSYKTEDVTILLQNIEGRVPILDTKEREKLNQSGVHYSEMLPLEYSPTKEYMNIYKDSLDELSEDTANAIAIVAEKIYQRKNGREITLVSLARAGTPIGILIKHYLEDKYKIEVKHYSISIIRGKGFDVKAMKEILKSNTPESIQFVDGWVGKGAIDKVLKDSLKQLNRVIDSKIIEKIDSELAVLSDPASVTSLYGTRQDFLIPSACLNATVSGLISRTVKLKNMTDEELHGAVYYKDKEQLDVSQQFIDTVEKHFNNINLNHFNPSKEELNEDFKGIDEVKKIGKDYNIKDLNKIKPGVGETTRVLLRRVPDRILLNKNADKKYLKNILQLCKDKDIPIEYYDLKKYNVCGIIKEVSDL